MTWKVLVSAPYFLPVIESWRPQLAKEGVELIAARVNERLSEEELLEVVADIDGIICGDDRITQRVLEAAPRLKVISKWGTGIDSIDAQAAAARGLHGLPAGHGEERRDQARAAPVERSRSVTTP